MRVSPRKSLAAVAYTDAAVFDEELDRVFAHSWQYVGHVERVREPGDYFVATIGRESLIVTRTDDGELNALFNVCAHRAARVATGAGRKRRFSCPYHGWTYDGHGCLTHAPNLEHVAGMRLRDYALTTCALEVVHGLIFVNLDASCEPIAQSAPGLADDIASFAPDLPELRFAHRTEATLKANWKVAVENFSECYHCPLVHRSFFSQAGDNEGGGVDPETYRVELHGVWQRHHGASYSVSDATVSGRTREEFGVWWLWPNFAVQCHLGSMVNVRQWVPVNVDTTHVFVDWFLPEAPGPAERQIFADHAAGVFAEDIPLVEMVQQGLGSRGYRGGPLMVDESSSVLSEHAIAAIQSLWKDAMCGALDDRY